MKKFGFAILAFFCFFAGVNGVHAADLSTIYGHDEVRLSLVTSIVTAPVATSLKYGAKTVKGKTLDTNVSVVRAGKDFYINFLRAEKPESAQYMPGDFVVRRNLDSSYILDFKVYLTEDGESFLLVVPSGSGCRMKIVVKGSIVNENIYIGNSIYMLLTKPFSTFVSLTSKKVDWNSIFETIQS